MKYIFKLSILFSFLLLVSCKNEVPKSEQNVATKPETQKKTDDRKTIVFFGNSLTAAYGLDPKEGYVALLQKKMDSLGKSYKAVNAGLSGETTAGGLTRVDWILKQKVDVFVLELGGNDMLRGIDPKATANNLRAILEKVRKSHPEAKLVLAGMMAPPNMGKTYINEFQEAYPKIAKEYGAVLIPFLLENVGGIKQLNLPDGIHPNPEGQVIVAENVWKHLKTVL